REKAPRAARDRRRKGDDRRWAGRPGPPPSGSRRPGWPWGLLPYSAVLGGTCYAEIGRLGMKLPLKGLVPRWMPLLLGALIVIGIAFDMMTRSELSATTAAMCEGEYADTLDVESARTRETEQGSKSQYSYLVRSSARYECPFF